MGGFFARLGVNKSKIDFYQIKNFEILEIYFITESSRYTHDIEFITESSRYTHDIEFITESLRLCISQTMYLLSFHDIEFTTESSHNKFIYNLNPKKIIFPNKYIWEFLILKQTCHQDLHLR